MRTEGLYLRIMSTFEMAYLGPWDGLYQDTPEDRH